MNYKLLFARLLLASFFGSLLLLYRSPDYKVVEINTGKFNFGREEREEEDEDQKMAYTNQRWQHEFEMLRNPITGKIPENFREMELAVARTIPEKGRRSSNPFLPGIMDGSGVTVQNNYVNIGPNNVAGRSRMLGIDRRNTNIMITGGTTGGIFRSTNGGTSWTFVSPENDIRSANTIAQDPANPDVWYCGTGEAYYPVSTAATARTYGYGIYKSVDNGASWTKLQATITNNNEHRFDNVFDLVNRISVHPTNGHVYAAALNTILRSTDGGVTWTAVLEGANPQVNALSGLTEIIIPSNGSKIYAAFTGENPDRAIAGVWESSTGNTGSWIRIAGGVQNAADSVAGWRAYGKWGRVILGLNNANTQLFVLYKNGESAEGGSAKPEADLYRADLTGTPPAYAWTNLNAWVPDEPNFNYEGIDPYTTQFNGFNMSLAVKPDNNNIIFIGGTNLHRVHLNETDPTKKFRRIGGYGEGFFPDDFIYPNHHPDVHWVMFHNTSSDKLYTASDGGVHSTSTSVMADTVRWNPLNMNLQTLQYQFININPIPEGNLDFIIGSAQDNGTLVNLNFQNQSTSQQVRERHSELIGGDGASSAVGGFTKQGADWKQYWFMSVSSGDVYRLEVDVNTDRFELDFPTDLAKITPPGQSGEGQWLTLFINDPDSSEHLYYNNRNRLWRTKTASTVTSDTWTEMTGVGATIPSSTNDFSAMAITKKRNNQKYLFMGTRGGKVYRLDNANLAAPTATPVDVTPPQMTQGSYVAGIALNPRNADTALIVVSNYDANNNAINNIFWSGNATSATPTWQVIDGALAPLSSQSCAIVVTNAGVEYYVGTSVGLYSTTTISGNQTGWFNEGGGMMKRAIIRALVNRQRDNTLVVGTHGNGAFIARIGNAVNLDVLTGINDPITNDSRFIKTVFPTVTSNNIQYTVGNLYSIKRIAVMLYNQKGQLVYKQDRAYSSGSVNLLNLPAGNYILNILSNDGKYRHIQKIIKH